MTKNSSNHTLSSFVTSGPRLILRLEGFFVFLASLLIYFQHQESSFLQLLLLFFIPDISLLAYFINSKVGAFAYNLTHSYVLPVLLLILSCFFLKNHTSDFLLFIWIAHIGFDRCLGFGLKYSDGFSNTHLGKINLPKF